MSKIFLSILIVLSLTSCYNFTEQTISNIKEFSSETNKNKEQILFEKDGHKFLLEDLNITAFDGVIAKIKYITNSDRKIKLTLDNYQLNCYKEKDIHKEFNISYKDNHLQYMVRPCYLSYNEELNYYTVNINYIEGLIDELNYIKLDFKGHIAGKSFDLFSLEEGEYQEIQLVNEDNIKVIKDWKNKIDKEESLFIPNSQYESQWEKVGIDYPSYPSKGLEEYFSD